MRPVFRILADSKDVTDAVKDRLLDMNSPVSWQGFAEKSLQSS